MSGPVVVCTISGQHAEASEEVGGALTLGRRIAAQRGVELQWLVLGGGSDAAVDTARAQGVASIHRVSDAKVGRGKSDAIVEAVAQFCVATAPGVVVFPLDFDTRPLGARVAGRIGAAVVMNAAAVSDSGGRLEVTAGGYGGDTRGVYVVAEDTPCVVGLIAGVVQPETVDGGGEPAVHDVAVDLSAVDERIRVVQAASFEGPRLEDADIVVAGGRGLGAQENFKLVEQLAEVLGGIAAASRPLVDEGWIDSSRQVGLTGKITRPTLYLAAGISGATQHMVGCTGAKTIVAINTDPTAAIFRYARYGIVGDCVEILPELIRASKEKLQR